MLAVPHLWHDRVSGEGGEGWAVFARDRVDYAVRKSRGAGLPFAHGHTSGENLFPLSCKGITQDEASPPKV